MNIWKGSLTMKNLRLKKALIGAMVCLNAIPATVSAGTLSSTVNLDITSTMIDVTVPLTVACNIDTNKAFEEAFTSAKLTIQNNTNAPVKIRANKLTANKGAIPLVNMDKYTDTDWSELLNDQCLSNIALGLTPINVENMLGAEFTEDWFTVADSNVTGFDIGIIKPLSNIELELVSKHGMVFKENKDNSYSLEYIATLE